MLPPQYFDYQERQINDIKSNIKSLQKYCEVLEEYNHKYYIIEELDELLVKLERII